MEISYCKITIKYAFFLQTSQEETKLKRPKYTVCYKVCFLLSLTVMIINTQQRIEMTGYSLDFQRIFILVKLIFVVLMYIISYKDCWQVIWPYISGSGYIANSHLNTAI
jgi:hypothetical protein